MKVKMTPSLRGVKNGESGIHTIVRKYYQYADDYGIEFVDDGDAADILAIHAGTTDTIPPNKRVVSHCHGLYFTGDYRMDSWAYSANRNVIDATRRGNVTTVPSGWVAEIFERDMHRSPIVLPHGVDADFWWAGGEHKGYVVSYAKNRDDMDVCDSTMSTNLARYFERSQVPFYQTFAKGDLPKNLQVTGVLPRDGDYRLMVQNAAVFVSPVKETFGIAALEAMAAGVPVLTPDVGGVPMFVEHGVSGYVYRNGNMEDMIAGLEYCLQYRDDLGNNAAYHARRYSWRNVVGLLADIYRGLHDSVENHDVAIVIPVYNKLPQELRRAVKSAIDHLGILAAGANVAKVSSSIDWRLAIWKRAGEMIQQMVAEMDHDPAGKPVDEFEPLFFCAL